MIDTEHLQKEVNALAKKYYVVRSNELQGYELRDFKYPEGWVLRHRDYWQQRRGVPRSPDYVAPLLVRVPDGYPYSQPYVYVPRTLEYTDGEVNHLLSSSQYPEWLPWCVRDLDWDPREHSIPWLIGLVQLSFSYPEADDPTDVLEVSRAEDYTP